MREAQKRVKLGRRSNRSVWIGSGANGSFCDVRKSNLLRPIGKKTHKGAVFQQLRRRVSKRTIDDFLIILNMRAMRLGNSLFQAQVR